MRRLLCAAVILNLAACGSASASGSRAATATAAHQTPRAHEPGCPSLRVRRDGGARGSRHAHLPRGGQRRRRRRGHAAGAGLGLAGERDRQRGRRQRPLGVARAAAGPDREDRGPPPRTRARGGGRRPGDRAGERLDPRHRRELRAVGAVRSQLPAGHLAGDGGAGAAAEHAGLARGRRRPPAGGHDPRSATRLRARQRSAELRRAQLPGRLAGRHRVPVGRAAGRAARARQRDLVPGLARPGARGNARARRRTRLRGGASQRERRCRPSADWKPRAPSSKRWPRATWPPLARRSWGSSKRTCTSCACA